MNFLRQALLRLLPSSQRRYYRRHPDKLDHRVLTWPDGSSYTVRDLLRSASIMGQTGSGKSSAALLAIMRALWRIPGSSGLILGSKPEDREWHLERAREAGREHDLIFFGPNDPQTCNFLEQAGDARDRTNLLIALEEGTQQGEIRQDADAMFWRQQSERVIHTSFNLLALAGQECSAPSLQRFIVTAAQKPDDLRDDKWQSHYHNQVLLAAAWAGKRPIEQADFEQAWELWLIEWPSMNDRTRTSIVANVMGLMHKLNSGICRQLISGGSTVGPADLERGKWIMVDMPIHQYGESARTILMGWKFIVDRHILRRHHWTHPIIRICDEAQEVMNSNDAAVMAQQRSHGGASIYLTQGIKSYVGRLGEAKAMELLSNMNLQCFFTVDAATAKYGVALLGQRLEVMHSGSMKSDVTLGQEIFGPPAFTGSFSLSYQNVLQEKEFLSGLRAGGPPDFVADSICIRLGEPFPGCGENYQRVSWSQR